MVEFEKAEILTLIGQRLYNWKKKMLIWETVYISNSITDMKKRGRFRSSRHRLVILLRLNLRGLRLKRTKMSRKRAYAGFSAQVPAGFRAAGFGTKLTHRREKYWKTHRSTPRVTQSHDPCRRIVHNRLEFRTRFVTRARMFAKR